MGTVSLAWICSAQCELNHTVYLILVEPYDKNSACKQKGQNLENLKCTCIVAHYDYMSYLQSEQVVTRPSHMVFIFIWKLYCQHTRF